MELLENKNRMHFRQKNVHPIFIGIMFFLLFDEFRGPVLFFRRLLKASRAPVKISSTRSTVLRRNLAEPHNSLFLALLRALASLITLLPCRYGHYTRPNLPHNSN